MAAVAAVVTLIGVPLLAVAWGSFHGIAGSTSSASGAWDRLVRSGGRTLVQASWSTVAALAVGVPWGWVLYRYRFVGRRFLLGVVTMPFVLPSLAIAAGVGAVMRPDGWAGAVGLRGISVDGSLLAVVVAHCVFNAGLVARVVGTGVTSLDNRALAAAKSLGVGRWGRLLRVVLPALMPTIARAAALVFVLCGTSFGVVLILGGPAHATVDVEIWYLVTQLVDLRSAGLLALAQLVAVAFVLWLASRTRVASGARSAPTRPQTRGAWCAVGWTALSAALLIGAPTAALVERSTRVRGGHSLWALGRSSGRLRHLDAQLWGDGAPAVWMRSAGLALICAAVAAAVCAGSAAGLLGRSRRRMEVALAAAVGASPAVVGVGVVLADRYTGQRLAPTAAVLWVQIAAAVPFAVVMFAGSVSGAAIHVVDAARVLGLRPLRAVLAVVVRPRAAALIAAAALAGAVALGEIGSTALVADSSSPTASVVAARFLSRPEPGAFRVGMGIAVILGVVAAVLTVIPEIADRGSTVSGIGHR